MSVGEWVIGAIVILVSFQISPDSMPLSCAAVVSFLLFRALSRKKERATPCFDILKFDEMSGEDFEVEMGFLLQELGYTDIRLTKRAGDHGLDIIAYNPKRKKIGFQCKRYQGSVGNSAVQQVYSGARYYNCTGAVVITNSYFTRAAQREADILNVELWDRTSLVKLIEATREIVVPEETTGRLVWRFIFLLFSLVFTAWLLVSKLL